MKKKKKHNCRLAYEDYCPICQEKSIQDTSDRQGFNVEEDGTITAGKDTSNWEKRFDEKFGTTLKSMMEIAEDEAGDFEIKYNDVIDFIRQLRAKWIEEGTNKAKNEISVGDYYNKGFVDGERKAKQELIKQIKEAPNPGSWNEQSWWEAKRDLIHFLDSI